MIKLFNKLWLFITNVIRSLDNVQNSGYSARKLTGLAAVLMGAYITVYLLPTEAQLHALYAWQILSLLCLGIVTVEQIIKLKFNQESKKE